MLTWDRTCLLNRFEVSKHVCSVAFSFFVLGFELMRAVTAIHAVLKALVLNGSVNVLCHWLFLRASFIAVVGTWKEHLVCLGLLVKDMPSRWLLRITASVASCHWFDCRKLPSAFYKWGSQLLTRFGSSHPPKKASSPSFFMPCLDLLGSALSHRSAMCRGNEGERARLFSCHMAKPPGIIHFSRFRSPREVEGLWPFLYSNRNPWTLCF